MNKKRKIRVPAILGPTAVGKTDISLRMASELGLEIISCDSRQIYKYLDIGTAKPSREAMREVRHWMIDIIEPSDYYSAYQYSQETLKIIRDDTGESRTKLICGGTGLYFNSLQDGLGPQVASSITFRETYMKKVLEEGRENIFKELEKCDPKAAARLHPNDVQRVIRALQVYYETGCPISEYQKKNYPPDDIEFFPIILSLPRNILYEQINKRVDSMVSNGLWDEFHLLHEKGYGESDPGMHCVGYRELFDVEKGTQNLSGAVEAIKKNSRHYAKRQITWFKHKTDGLTIDVSDQAVYSGIKKKIVHFLNS